MATSFRQSRFRSSRSHALGEDVNPSAYIVNLADCMLVLACGFLVALMSYWNIDVRAMEELQAEDLEQVEPAELPAEMSEGGSYYVEAGTVYRDPATGILYLRTPDQELADPAGTPVAEQPAAGLGLAQEQPAEEDRADDVG